MSQGYVDPITKKYVQSAGNLNVMSAPEATETQKGIMTPAQVKKLDSAYTSDDVASVSLINDLFK